MERVAFRSGETTRFRKTAIRITASDNDGVTDMQLSEDPAFRRAIWQTFDGSTQFVLSAGAGEKTLFVRVRDRSGNVSAAGSASITLVRRPPP